MKPSGKSADRADALKSCAADKVNFLLDSCSILNQDMQLTEVELLVRPMSSS
jgi:hypothetical protein